MKLGLQVFKKVKFTFSTVFPVLENEMHTRSPFHEAVYDRTNS